MGGVGGCGVVVPCVDHRTGNGVMGEGVEQGLLVDDRAAADIDHHRLRLHPGKGRLVHQSFGFCGQRQRGDEIVNAGIEIIQLIQREGAVHLAIWVILGSLGHG